MVDCPKPRSPKGPILKMVGEKKCLIPTCPNTSISTPIKLFLTCPKSYYYSKGKGGNSSRRLTWLALAGLEKNVDSPTCYYACEDHFNLQEDAANWIYFKTLGNRLLLKDHVVPHLNLDAPCSDTNQSQLEMGAREIRRQNLKKISKKLVKDRTRRDKPHSLLRKQNWSVAPSVSPTEIFSLVEEIEEAPQYPQLTPRTPPLVDEKKPSDEVQITIPTILCPKIMVSKPNDVSEAKPEGLSQIFICTTEPLAKNQVIEIPGMGLYALNPDAAPPIIIQHSVLDTPDFDRVFIKEETIGSDENSQSFYQDHDYYASKVKKETFS